MSLYLPVDSEEEDDSPSRSRVAITPQEAWSRWTHRRDQDDVEAIQKEVAQFLAETRQFQEASDLFLTVQRPRYCLCPILQEVIEAEVRELATELIVEGERRALEEADRQW